MNAPFTPVDLHQREDASDWAIEDRCAFQTDDGGRAAAGFKGEAGDCVCRAIAITTGRPYREVYAALAQGNGNQRRSKRDIRNGVRRGATARKGISTGRKWFADYMASLGFEWVPTMQIGQGCKVHLRASELPRGRIIAQVTRHSVAVIDGVIHDTHDPSRDGTRCVYGYWQLVEQPDEEPFYDADYYGHAPDEDEIADLRRSMRKAGPYRAALIEARLVERGEGE